MNPAQNERARAATNRGRVRRRRSVCGQCRTDLLRVRLGMHIVSTFTQRFRAARRRQQTCARDGPRRSMGGRLLCGETIERRPASGIATAEGRGGQGRAVMVQQACVGSHGRGTGWRCRLRVHWSNTRATSVCARGGRFYAGTVYDVAAAERGAWRRRRPPAGGDTRCRTSQASAGTARAAERCRPCARSSCTRAVSGLPRAARHRCRSARTSGRGAECERRCRGGRVLRRDTTHRRREGWGADQDGGRTGSSLPGACTALRGRASQCDRRGSGSRRGQVLAHTGGRRGRVREARTAVVELECDTMLME